MSCGRAAGLAVGRSRGKAFSLPFDLFLCFSLRSGSILLTESEGDEV